MNIRQSPAEENMIGPKADGIKPGFNIWSVGTTKGYIRVPLWHKSGFLCHGYAIFYSNSCIYRGSVTWNRHFLSQWSIQYITKEASINKMPKKLLDGPVLWSFWTVLASVHHENDPKDDGRFKKRYHLLANELLEKHRCRRIRLLTTQSWRRSSAKGLLCLLCAGDTENSKQPEFYVEPEIP